VAGSFSATVDTWVDETEARMLAVFREAAQRVIELMQKVGPSVANPDGGEGGNMPVDTGFLRASLLATLNSPSDAIRFKPDNVDAFSYSDGAVSLVILGAQIGDTIYAVYTANYARFVEYGANGRAGYAFVRLAAQNWQQVVDEVARDAQARAAGGAPPVA
jgi:hypothetical protein